ncbi:MAG: succinate dehydrogenase assembly factor 2 [Marinibacterium sp.]|nr:succinate dehydrogenase assembly factor 2 [Marinibacterium sp.]
MTETLEHRRKRLHMRSIRRGIKEMDLILGHYAQTVLPQMPEADLDLYEALLNEPDQDLYTWVNGQVAAPEAYRDLIKNVAQAFQK